LIPNFIKFITGYLGKPLRNFSPSIYCNCAASSIAITEAPGTGSPVGGPKPFVFKGILETKIEIFPANGFAATFWGGSLVSANEHVYLA